MVITMMMHSEFTIRGEHEHTVTVSLSLFSGLEIYLVDGVEVLRCRSFAVWGTRSFVIACEEPLSVEIRMNQFQRYAVQAYVNGKLTFI